jgi:hypothetical protein
MTMMPTTPMVMVRVMAMVMVMMRVMMMMVVVVVIILGTRLLSQISSGLQVAQFSFRKKKSEACLPKVHADSSTPGADLLSITLTVDQAISGGVLGTLN